MKETISIRLNSQLLERLRKASGRPLAPTMTKIIERGIELALRELERRK
jgi:hypothetical protein